MTKPEIIAKLTELGIEHDATATKPVLEALLPEGSANTKSEREQRWETFLVEARKVNPERFDAQEARGEFTTIPDSFA